jgi:RimJ/RimL family protein N-acetyltransferase
MGIPVLTTHRLTLRPFTPDDAARVNDLLATPEIADTTLNIAHPYPEGAAERWIASHVTAAADGTGWTWAIALRDGGELIGAIGLGVVAAHRRGSLGYWLGVPFWNHGYMSEAARRVVAFGFEELGLHRIDAQCMTRNAASARVMERAGMTYEGTARDYIVKHGRFEDIASYAVIREEGDRQ